MDNKLLESAGAARGEEWWDIKNAVRVAIAHRRPSSCLTNVQKSLVREIENSDFLARLGLKARYLAQLLVALASEFGGQGHTA